jgi:hypothetical protein
MIPPFIPFLLLGGANGLLLGAMEGWLGGPGWTFSVMRLFGYPLIGVLSLAAVSVLSLAFPGFTDAKYLNVIKKAPSGVADSAKWVAANGGSVLLGGIFNGLAFWVAPRFPQR